LSLNNYAFSAFRNTLIVEYKMETRVYVGESKIIRTIGTCFAVGYTAGWS